MVRYIIDGDVSNIRDSFMITVTVKKGSSKPAVTATAKDGKLTLKWKTVPGAEKYSVYARA